MTGSLQRRDVLLLAVVAALVVVVVIRAPEYLAINSVANILTNWGFLAILALGQLAVLLTRGIDLSQASILAFTGMFLALLSQEAPDLPAIVFLILAIVLGAGLGAVNAAAIALAGLPPIIATLGTMAVIRGMIYVLSEGAWISAHEMSEAFKSFPASQFLGVPNVFWVAFLCTIGFYVFLSYFAGGRNIYALGGNPEAARNAGVSQVRTEILVYMLSGSVAGLCGYLWAGRFAIAYTQAAEGREFAIIAACVIGGASIAGGRGTVVGVVLGALLISVLETALPFLKISPFVQLAIIGAVILVAVAVNARAELRPGRQILERSPAEGHAGP